MPSLARGTQFAVNCDESQLILIGPDPEGKTVPRTPPAGGAGGTLEANWAAGTPKKISSIDIRTGAMRVLHRENDWTMARAVPVVDIARHPAGPHRVARGTTDAVGV